MNPISLVSNRQPAALPSTPIAGRAAAYTQSGTPPSAIVQLSPESLAAARQAGTEKTVLPLSARFKDVGAAMLKQFNTGAAIPVTQAALPDNADNTFTLGIVTRTGVKVDLALATLEDGMVLQASASGELDDAERSALARLADGFQAAIDGMAGDPQIRIGALANFDSKALRSVDFHAQVTLATLPPGVQTLDFHADGGQRKVGIGGPAGRADITVDSGKLAGTGTKQQQAKAISHYLKQFDQAAERGHGERQLMAMFKDAFADMSRTSTRDEEPATGLVLPGRRTPAAEEDAVLTGLSDFTASVAQVPGWPNPLRTAEKDSFDYAVSQQTRIDGARNDDRTVAQTQQAHLTAQFHTPPKKGGELQLDVTPQSQHYDYHQIDDTADSNVELGYRDGRLVKAAMQQSASQSERIQTYVMGKLASDKTVPGRQALVRDLMASLASYRAGEDLDGGDGGEARETRRRQQFDALNTDAFLRAVPDALAVRRGRTGNAL